MASIFERIDLGYARNLMGVLTSLTAAKSMLKYDGLDTLAMVRIFEFMEGV